MQTFSAHIILGNVIWIVFKHVDIWSWKTTLGIPSLAWQRKTFWKMLLGFYVIMVNFESWNIKSCNIQIAWVNFFSWLVKPFLAKSNLESSVKNLQISKFSLISQCVWFLEADRKNISDRIYLSKVTGPSSSLNDNSSVGLLACKSHFTRSTFRKWQSANTQAKWWQVINYNPAGKYIFKTGVKTRDQYFSFAQNYNQRH